MAVGGLQNMMAGPNGTLIPDLRTYGGYDAAIASGQVSQSEADQSQAAINALASSTASSGGGSVSIGATTAAQAVTRGGNTNAAASVQNQGSGNVSDMLNGNMIQILGVLVGIIAIYAATKG